MQEQQNQRKTVPLGRTGHDAEHLGPDDNEQEHCGRKISKTSLACATAGNDDVRTVVLVHTVHVAEQLSPADKRREYSESTKTAKPAMDRPLPLSTTSAATREATARKFLLLPLFPSPRRPVVPLLVLFPPLLNPLPGLVQSRSSREVTDRGGIDGLSRRPSQYGQAEGREVSP